MTGLSLYADLLDEPDSGDGPSAAVSSAATVSGAPVIYGQDGAAIRNAVIQYPPFIRRPVAANKSKSSKLRAPPGTLHRAAPSASKPVGSAAENISDATPAPAPVPAPAPAAAPVAKGGGNTLEDWVTPDDDEWLRAGPLPPRQGNNNWRRKRRKAADDQAAAAETDWSEIYDPARPTNVEEYMNSDERVWEIREWRTVLYRRRMRDKEGDGSEDGGGDSRSREAAGGKSAPPGTYSFVPPPKSPVAPPSGTYSSVPPPKSPAAAPSGTYSSVPPPKSPVAAAAAPAPAVAVGNATPPVDETGDDAYFRRLALSQGAGVAPPPPPPTLLFPADGDGEGGPPPLRLAEVPQLAEVPRLAEVPPQAEVPPPTKSASIFRPPIIYAQAARPLDSERDASPPRAGIGGGTAASDDDDNEENRQDDGEPAPAPRSNRPGQAGFAQRLMNKYGWTKGTGLGADESGIVSALHVKVDKRWRRRPDAAAGGRPGPAVARGRIVGGKRKPREDGEEDEGYGTMSEVVVLRGMLESMPDLEAEIEQGLGQEIGEECGEKYGRVERLYIDVEHRQVFIRFTDQISALRAVNELDGRIFNGNPIAPAFYDCDKFEKGIYR